MHEPKIGAASGFAESRGEACDARLDGWSIEPLHLEVLQKLLGGSPTLATRRGRR